MVVSTLRPLILLSLLWTLVASQTPVPPAADALEAFPGCAKTCIASAFGGDLCAPTNQTCVCSDAAFQRNVTLCITTTCSIPDSLVARNASLTNCGAPVRDRSGEYIVLSNTMVVIAAVAITVRFAYKIWAKVELGMDDWIILATIISAIPSAVLTVHGAAKNGLGKDIWTLTPTEITNVLFYFYHMAYLYFLLVALVKLSIISFYIRVFPAANVQRVLWASFIVTVLWALGFILAVIFQCRPIHYFWVRWDGMHEGHCASASVISWTHASINIALDLWVLAIPMWQLMGLQLHWKKKVGVAIMFCVGTFVTVVSILRLRSLVNFAKTNNTSWEFFDVSMWSTIEVLTGVVCACLPAIRLVLITAFPRLGGSSSMRSRGNKYYQHDPDAPRSRMTGVGGVGTIDSKHGTVGVVTTRGIDSDPEAAVNGIVFQKTYEVQYTNEDETRLVPMTDLDHAGKPVRK